MKKLLLSLFCLLAVAATTATANAEETLAATLAFNNWDSQTPKVSAYDTTWECIYNSKKWSIANFNNNNKGWTSIKAGRKNNASTATISTTFPFKDEVSKIELTIDAITASNVTSINLKKSTDGKTWSDTNYSFNKAKGFQTVEIPQADRDENLYIQIEFVCTSASSNGIIQISEVKYYTEPAVVDPSVIKMSASDLSIAFHETKDLDNITFTPELTTGDLYTLTFSGEYGDALTFSGDCTNGYTVYGNTTGTYNVNVDFNGLGGSVEGKTGSASFDVTVGRDPSTFAEYTLVTDLDQIGESANILIAYASGTTADLMGSSITSGYVVRTDISKFYDSTAKSFKEDESYSPFIIEVNPDVPGEYRINISTKANPAYLNCDAVTTSSTNLTSTTTTNASNGYWTLSVSADGTASIKRGYNTLRCNTGTTPHRFKTYSSTTGVLPQIYVDKSSVVLPDPYTQKVTQTTDIKDLPFHGVATLQRPLFKVTPSTYDSYTLEYTCDTPGVIGFSTVADETDNEKYTNSITVTSVNTPVYVKGLLSEGTSTITAKFTGILEGKTYTAEAKFNVNVLQDPLPDEGSIDAEAVTVEVGKSQQIVYDIDPNFPEEPGDEDYIKFTTDSEHFTVDENGVVTGISEGEGDITINVHMFCGPDKCHEYTLEGTAHVYVKPETPHYRLVTDINQLGQEAKVYIVSAEARKILGADKSGYREAQILEEADITDNNTLIFYDKNYVEFTVSKKPATKAEQGLFSFYDNTPEKGGYLTSSKNTELKTVTDPVYPTLTIDENGNAKIFFGEEIGQIKYNSSTTSNRFSSYLATTSQYKPVQLFVRSKSVVPVDEYEMFMEAKDIEVKYLETVNLDNITYSPDLDQYEKVEIEYLPSKEGVVEIDQTAEIHTLKGIKSQGTTDVTVNFKGYRGEKEYTGTAKFAVKVGKDPLPEHATIEVAENIVVEIGEEPVALNLNITPDVTENEYTITYDEEAIKIENGLVSGLKEGETEVTITLDAIRGEEGEHHYEDSLTFTVTVLPAPVKYELVKDRKSLGKEALVIIASNANGAVMSTTVNKNNLGATLVTGLNGTTDKIKHQSDFAVIKLTKLDNGNFTLYHTGENKYLTSSSSENKLNLSDEPTEATVTIATNGNATITFVGQRTIKYNNGQANNLLFGTYTSGQKDVQLYMVPQEVVLTPVTLSWYAYDNTSASDIEVADSYTTTAELGYDDNGAYKLENVRLALKASVENFPLDKVTVSTNGIASTVGTKNEWNNDEFSYTKPGKYSFNVTGKQGYDLSEDWVVTFPEELFITINKMKPEFAQFEAPIEMGHIASIYTPAEDGSSVGTHDAQEHYFKFWDESVFYPESFEDFVNMEAKMTANFPTNAWQDKVNAGKIDVNNPEHHAKWHHIYYSEPEEVMLDYNELIFSAHQPGQYKLTISIADEYKDWFSPASQDYLINLNPRIDGVEITKMIKTVIDGETGFAFGYYGHDFSDEADKPTSSDHEYYEDCRVIRSHNGDVYVNIMSQPEGLAYRDDENSSLSRISDEDLSDYTKVEFDDEDNPTVSTTTLNLRNAKGLSLVEDVNGVRSATPYVAFDGASIPTIVEEISAIEVADGETLYFTLQGIRVMTDKLAPGIYVRRTSNETGLILVH